MINVYKKYNIYTFDRCQGSEPPTIRALDNRSIFAAPFSTSVRNRINSDIKERESFRPFAPVATPKADAKYFGINAPLSSPMYYILMTVSVKDEYRNDLVAIIHVDGSARIQVVTGDRKP